MAVKFIIDSAADFPYEEAKACGHEFLPIGINFEDGSFADGIDITHAEFYKKLADAKVFPFTSQVSPQAFENAFEAVKQAGDTAVVVALSSKLSGTFQSAVIARDGYEDCVFLVDSENACIGEQLLVRYGMQLAQEGKSAKEIADILNDVKKDIRLFAVLDTLEYLKKGGRISAVAAIAGGLLNIKPVISVVDGAVESVGKARGAKQGFGVLTELVTKSGGADLSMPILAGFSGDSTATIEAYLEANSKELFGDKDVKAMSIGSTIGTHVGPGAYAIAYFGKK